MCGRYVITLTLEELQAVFGTKDRPNLQPSWNAAPTQDLPVVRRGREGERRLTPVRWGLVPSWSKQPPARAKPLINARSETAAEKPAFRAAMKRRRCLVPADGFYEWSGQKGDKQPWFITRTDGAPMVFAGLWERWTGEPDPGAPEESVDTFCILTAEASADIAHLHERCPVILEPAAFAAWLDPETDPQPFLAAPGEGRLEARPVSRRVNKVAENDAGLLDPAQD